ncbi:hypothetical protein N7492_007520 [Penicillium capsulatum]|uniref:Uncharacterized protein n=1 Tax=Penicillium capsulatum TaxID=69766 RepID=A0A9W9HZZ4_9EURO|nr:hypothetical protein N7492_007520 [Penicillium capsulatum]
MPFPATPPFHLSRRQPRRSAGPQFANSPRFLLSQGTQKSDDVDIVDDDALTAPVAQTPLPRAIPPRPPNDVIEDSDDELAADTGPRRNDPHEIGDTIDSSPGNPDSPQIGDPEFDALFTPLPRANKRQRLSAANPSLEEKLREEPGETEISSLDRQERATDAPDSVVQETPKPARPIPPGIPTPASTNTPFRSKPRFMLSAKKPLNNQSLYKPEIPHSQPKPTFVLPRSPSPGADDEDIPAPFSPSSRTLNRRGRPRPGVPGYTPGVRSWILEMGTKRDQPARLPASAGKEDLDRYLVAARVVNVRQTVVASSGPLAFIEAEAEAEAEGNISPRNGPLEPYYIMAMGAPRSRPSSQSSRIDTTKLQTGDLIGVHRGLTWELGLPITQSPPTSVEYSSELPENDGSTIPRRRWLVAMEWDLVQTL